MRHLARGAHVAAALALLATASPAAAQTNGFVLHCLSARTAGQGCVTRAQSDAPSALFRDPAGIAHQLGGLEVNVAAFMPGLTFRNDANPAGADGALHVYPLASAAFVAARPDSRLAWALGFEPIGGFGADFRLRHALLSGAAGPPVDYESFFAAAKLGPVVAYRLTPRLAVGASASVVYAQIRDFRMPFTLPPDLPRGLPAIAGLDPAVYGPLFQQFTELTAYGDSRDYAGTAWAADVGLAYRHPSGLAVSVSFSPRTRIEADGGTAVIDMTAQFGRMLEAMVGARAQAYGETPDQAQAAVMQQLAAAGLDLQAGVRATYDAATEFNLPLTVGAGATVPLRPGLTLAAEVEWRRWSEAEATMPFRLTNGDNGNINLLMNLDPANGSFTYPFPLDWRDAWTAKAGIEHVLDSGIALRAGYVYGQNPVPDNTVFATFPAIATNAVTAGVSVSVGRLPLDVSVVHAFRTESIGDPDGHRLGAEYVRSTTTLQETVLTLGARWPF